MRQKSSKNNGILFTVFTVLWTWGLLSIPIIFKFTFDNPITKLIYILTGASPSVIGLLFVLNSRDRVYIRSFFKRIVTFGKVRVIDIFTVFLLVPVAAVLSAYIGYFFTSTSPDWSKITSYQGNIGGLLLFAVFTLVFGPLAEEIGWRGFLIDSWKDRGVGVYGVVIGAIWTMWHLPMFFITGTYQNTLLLQGAVSVLSFAVSTTALGVIIGALAIRTGAILPAILFHFIINFTGELIPLSLTADAIQTVLLTIIAIAIIIAETTKAKRIIPSL